MSKSPSAAPSSSPQNLTGTSISSDTITLSWSPPPTSDTNGVIREYRINITEVETGRVFLLTSTTTSITVQSLHPYYTYQCTVSTYTVGVGPYTTIFRIRTPEDGELTSLIIGINLLKIMQYLLDTLKVSQLLLHLHDQLF